ncbi:hypothetical protein PHYPO_G00215150 [Pangasianodon hypophthalmus]|uniref:Uncharacterized protein n=1 Tax=Pangasianodon hypophthalmus TaxID=310915 RepID=A0A5N5P5S7_PANHP|nr:hypothetical protein PHYPO_G00215150 [Pangasianodon hypophthalmus]
MTNSVYRKPGVYHELKLVGKNLRESFFDALDHYIFRKKKGLAGQLLAELLRQTKTTEPTDVRSLCLHGLPVILGDDPSIFFKTCSDVTDKDSYQQIPVGILCFDPESPQLNPSRVCIILEGNSVMEPDNLPQAFCLLFGLIYALHLEYPKCLKNTLHFFQQIFLKVNLAPKINSFQMQFKRTSTTRHLNV